MCKLIVTLFVLLFAHPALARPVVRNIQSTHEFDRLLRKHAQETGLPVVVDFYSESCGPCRQMAPIFKKVAADFTDKAVFVKIDTNRQPELSQRYQIRSLPTFQYFLDGRKANQAVGGIGEAALRQQTDQLVRQAELENVVLTLPALTTYYQEKDSSKSESDIRTVHEKCVGMTKQVSDCVGAAANQLARRLKKKYGSAPKMVPRFTADARQSDSTNNDSSSSSSSSGSRKKEQTNSNSKNNKPSGPNLHLATLEELEAELERRLDEIREEQVESEEPDDDEVDEKRWSGPGEFPERLIIIGGGPAGMAAALYGARAGLEPLVIAPSLGGQLQGKGVEVENYPGLFWFDQSGSNGGPNNTNATTGPALIASMRAQAAHFGAVFEDDIVFTVTVPERDPAAEYAGAKPKPLQVHTNSTGTIETHALIVATGAEANWLGIPGEWELRGGGVSSCAVCDGFLYAGRDVIIVGGGDAAMEDALVLARTSRKVTVVHRRDHFRASKVLADRVLDHPLIAVRWNSTVQEIVGKAIEPSADDTEDTSVDMDNAEMVVEAVILKDVPSGATERINCDAVFVAIGHTPATSFLQGIVDFDPDHPGYIHVGKGTTATSVSGVFAAGDVSDATYRQAITSAGSGAAAALDAERYLSERGLGNEAAELEAELLLDLLNDAAARTTDDEAYNIYEDAGGRMEGMKESIMGEL